MGKVFTVFFFLLSIFFFHSCAPCGDQRDELSLSRADDEIIRNYRSSFESSDFFLSVTKTCPHCGKLVGVETSVGECMFLTLSEKAPGMDPDTLREEAKKVRIQLRGEAEEGHGPANCLLGMIAEYGLFGFPRDTIAAARYYRLFADTGTAEGYAALASFWIRMGEYLPQAVSLLEKALGKEPRNTQFGMFLSEAYMLQGRRKEAFEAAKRAYYYSPINSTERDAIEVIFLERLLDAAPSMKPDEVIREINDLIYLAPKNKALVFERADLYLILEKFDLAEKDAKSLQGEYPELPLKLLNVRIAVGKGDYKTAYAELDKLIKENPADFTVRHVYLRTLMREGRAEDAFKAAAGYIENDSDKTAAYLFRARFRLENNMLQEAIEDFEAAAELAPPDLRDRIEKEISRVKKMRENQLPEI